MSRPERPRPTGGPGDLVLGVDLGTTGFKAGAFDAEGHLVAAGKVEYALDRPRVAWAEQPAERWWEAFELVLSQIRENVDTRLIRAISVAGQSPTVVPVGPDGAALRPAITWADRRAVAQAAWMTETLGAGFVSIEFESLPRILWIRDNEPEVFGRTAAFLQSYEYLAFRLTGAAVTIEPLDGLPSWTDDRLERLGLERTRFPARTVGAGRVIGTVRPAVAEAIGLHPEAQVVSGTVDAFAHWIGVNLSSHGQLSNIGGTSEGVAFASDAPLTDPRHRVFRMRSPFGAGWVIGGAMSNSGGLLDWAVAKLGGPRADHDSVLAAIARVRPGSEGLIALPYFRGERTPIYDANARGCFFGVTAEHGPEHLGRALLEGVAFGLRQVVGILSDIGGDVERVVISGGTARAAAWNRIKADVLGKPVHVPSVTDSGVLGAAILARAAVSDEPLSHVAQRMVHDREVIEPDAKNTAVYDQTYPLFLELYERLKEPYRRLAELSPSA